MKLLKFFLVIFFLQANFSLISAQNYYESQWKKINDNSEKGVYKSNIPLLLDMQNRAMKEKNVIEFLKSLQSEFSIIRDTKDDENNDGVSLFFKKLQKHEKDFNGEQQLVYQIIASQFLYEYYEQNSWKINARTQINNTDVSQIETWSKLDFKTFLNAEFEKFQNKKKLLKNISLLAYKDLFTSKEWVDYIPTFYDWVFIKEIKFLKDNSLFTPNELKENSSKIYAMYDELIRDANATNKVFYHHEKLKYTCSVEKCNDKIEKLESIINLFPKSPYTAFVLVDLVHELTSQKKFKEAVNWIEKSRSQLSNSEFNGSISILEKQIKNPRLSISYEKQVISHQPIHISAKYKNLSGFSLKLYQVKNELEFLEQINSYQYNNSNTTLTKSLIRTENYELKDFRDYDTHTTSLEIKPLKPGLYVAEEIVNGNVENNIHFIVTESLVIPTVDAEKKSEKVFMRLVSNDNGNTMVSSNLVFYGTDEKGKKSIIEGKTNRDGVFEFPSLRKYFPVLIKSSTDNYNLLPSNAYISNFQNRIENEKKQAQIFLDRKIYRPGQTLYFKVISSQLLNGEERVLPNEKQNVLLIDANGETVSKQQFSTNEFGSLHGSFILPINQLNGHFSIRVESNNINSEESFQVEEYKRPKFEIHFEPLSGEYKYGQKVLIKGNVKTFSGVPLSNLDVNYDIKKNDIRGRYFSWIPIIYNNENSILGTVKTDEKGEFGIEILLNKNENISGIQIENYEINAEVTDGNGETQFANQQFSVSSLSHYITLDEVRDFLTNETVNVKISAKNYNNQTINKGVQVKLTKLKSKERVFRNTFREDIQDAPQISKEEFIKKFPSDYYDEKELKDDISTEIVLSRKVDSNLKDGELNLGRLNEGRYLLEVYNVEGKDTIKVQRKFDVFNPNKLQSSEKVFLKVLQSKNVLKQGEKGVIYVYSSIPNVKARVYIQDGTGKTLITQKAFKNGTFVQEIIAPNSDDVENMNIQIQLIAYNEVQTQSVNFKIESSKTPLRVETVSFRDKLEPGVNEKWSFKIVGSQSERINAEVLATMYDQSLDKFAKNIFQWQKLNVTNSVINNFGIYNNLGRAYFSPKIGYSENKYFELPEFLWFTFNYGSKNYPNANLVARAEGVMLGKSVVNDLNYVRDKSPLPKIQQEILEVTVRKNLNETAFFYPVLRTDENGNLIFEFTSPEALSQWKLMLLAHTKDARYSILEKNVVTYKDFSVQPNFPRFLREGDELLLQSKVTNQTNEKLSGKIVLQLLDANTNEDITSKFDIQNAVKDFTIDEISNSVISWKVKTNSNLNSIVVKVVATANSYSDGEQQIVPILPNKKRITETVPIFVKEGENKTFELKNLTQNTSKTLENLSHTVELTTNSIWEVIFALPTLKEDENTSSDVQFNKWFADVLALYIIQSHPKIRMIFENYQNKGGLKSNLEKNEELKQVLLQETPWVFESKNETEQMQKLARLFDMNTIKNSIQNSWNLLMQYQNEDGGFSWQKGYSSSYTSSLYILRSLGKLKFYLGDRWNGFVSVDHQNLVSKLVGYVDKEMGRNWIVQQENIWSNWALDYLDSRRYWEVTYPLKNESLLLKNKIIKEAPKKDIKNLNFYELHRAALLFNDYKLTNLSNKILLYLKETSTSTETQGVYWKNNLNKWGWYGSKISNQAGVLEAYNSILPSDIDFIENLKIHLIMQKELSSWSTSKTTAEVIFTILNSGKNWTNGSENSTIIWGKTNLSSKDSDIDGYIKKTVFSDRINPDLGKLTISKKDAGIIQGGLYWQYFENFENIKSSENTVSITKEIYHNQKTENGNVLKEINSELPLKVGDKVTIRLILNSDRDMEYVHLKDMKAAGFEPLNANSGYQWRNSLSFYQSHKDASVDFFIEKLPKGKYVFEYDVICNASGSFNNGIAMFQNYYAPQMSSHTKGGRVEIK